MRQGKETTVCDASKITPGITWLRNRTSGEAVLVTEANKHITRYQNIDCDGEIATDRLHSDFEVLTERPADAEDF